MRERGSFCHRCVGRLSMKRASKRKETARKIKPSATQAKRKDKNEAHGVTDKTAVCYEQQDFTVNCNDGYASRPSKVLGDITNTGTRATGEKAKRRNTRLTLAPMELTLGRDRDLGTPSILRAIQARPSPHMLSTSRDSVPSLFTGDFQSTASTAQRKPTDKLPIANALSVKAGEMKTCCYTGSGLKRKQLVPKATSSPVDVEAIHVVSSASADGLEELPISPIECTGVPWQKITNMSPSLHLEQKYEDIPDDILGIAPDEWFPENKQPTCKGPILSLPDLSILPQDILEVTSGTQ